MTFQTADEMYEESLDQHTVRLCLEKEWRVVLACKACGHVGGLRFEKLRVLPPELTMRQIAEAARCARCGELGAWVDHRNDPDARQHNRAALPRPGRQAEA